MSKPDLAVRDMVVEYLLHHKYDGLYHPEGECACLADDLAPCQMDSGIPDDCHPGIKEDCTPACDHGPDGYTEGGWHITTQRR